MFASHRPTPTHRRLRLTRRGRLVRTIVVAVLFVLAAVVVVSGLRSLGAGADDAASRGASPSAADAGAPASDGGGQPSDAGGEPSDAGGEASDDGGDETESAAATPEEPEQDGAVTAAGHTAVPNSRGILRSDMQATGEFTVAPAQSAAPGEGTVHRYVLQVENGTGIDPAEAAAQVEQILADERGWATADGVAFERVEDPAQAELTITLAAPETVDRMCAPLRTGGVWNCHTKHDTVLNADRWLFMTPTYNDVTAYRTYQVNHEIGHFLGHDHEPCGGEGRAAPVMLQQSMGLDGCRANPWPTADGEA